MSGLVAVWGCAEYGFVIEHTDYPDEIEFYGVYKSDEDGLWAHQMDFKSREKALAFGKAIAALDDRKFFDYTPSPQEFP